LTALCRINEFYGSPVKEVFDGALPLSPDWRCGSMKVASMGVPPLKTYKAEIGTEVIAVRWNPNDIFIQPGEWL